MSTHELKTKVVETGKINLSINILGLARQNVGAIVRDVRHTLENCAKIQLMDGFTETRLVEYREVCLIEGAE